MITNYFRYASSAISVSRNFRILVLTILGLLLFIPFLSLAAAPDCNLITDTATYSEPSLAKPGYLQTVTDPTFGTKITRISGDPGTAIPNISGSTWGSVVRHHYSKSQAWNADMTLLRIARNTEGGTPSGTIFLDGSTYQPKFSRSAPSGGQIRWHPTLPDIIVYVSGNVIGHWNVRTDVRTPLRTFSEYSNLQLGPSDLQFGPSEGQLSADGALIAVLATDSSGKTVAFAYNMNTDTKHPDIPMGSLGTIDWVSISAGGNYIVVNDTNDNTSVYTLSGSKVGSTWTEYGRPSHYDLAIDDQGEEVAVGVSKSSLDVGRVIKRGLRDGAVTVLTTGGFASHTSARNLNRSGWAYTTYTRETTPTLYRGEIVAVKLDGTGVERIVHNRNITKDYLTEVHGSPSPDGQRVVFASDWLQSSGRPVQLYVVDFRDECRGART